MRRQIFLIVDSFENSVLLRAVRPAAKLLFPALLSRCSTAVIFSARIPAEQQPSRCFNCWNFAPGRAADRWQKVFVAGTAITALFLLPLWEKVARSAG
ncbi:MAG TPA: hypothetical protein VK980_06840 [Sphingomonas sp.]|nr:hypothetical protein [Sphingomonas sp.]